jgi:CRISPR/Cas system CSM-associated protein Csm3 (group 7 of RAMP superfamily)
MPMADLVQLTYRLTFTTLFHCGTGVRTGLIDRSVIRDHAGYLYIPGSTFKGNVRERCEQLARLFDPTSGQPGAQPWGRIASPHDREQALHGLGPENPSMVTRIFGSQAIPGRLFFDDASLSSEEKARYVRQLQEEETPDRRASRRDYTALQVNAYTQVRLDRRTRTAVPGALYSSEFGTGGLAFTGSIQGWLACRPIEAVGLQDKSHANDMPTYSLLLLLAGLQMVERLGGNKSSGKGQCTCKIQGLRLNHHQIQPERWHAWLDYLQELAHYDDPGRTSA